MNIISTDIEASYEQNLLFSLIFMSFLILVFIRVGIQLLSSVILNNRFEAKTSETQHKAMSVWLSVSEPIPECKRKPILWSESVRRLFRFSNNQVLRSDSCGTTTKLAISFSYKNVEREREHGKNYSLFISCLLCYIRILLMSTYEFNDTEWNVI